MPELRDGFGSIEREVVRGMFVRGYTGTARMTRTEPVIEKLALDASDDDAYDVIVGLRACPDVLDRNPE